MKSIILSLVALTMSLNVMADPPSTYTPPPGYGNTVWEPTPIDDSSDPILPDGTIHGSHHRPLCLLDIPKIEVKLNNGKKFRIKSVGWAWKTTSNKDCLNHGLENIERVSKIVCDRYGINSKVSLNRGIVRRGNSVLFDEKLATQSCRKVLKD